MLSAVREIFRKGLQAARRLFSSAPVDSLAVGKESLAYSSGGKATQCPIADVAHVSVEESFLGLFGSTVNIRMSDGARTPIRGLENAAAQELKIQLDKEMRVVMLKTARERLANAGKRISAALAALEIEEYVSAWRMSHWEEEFSDLKFLALLEDEVFGARRGKAWDCRRIINDPKAWREQRNVRWVAQEQQEHGGFFDTLFGSPLTKSQRQAILSHDNRVLAVAGAGTGKTTTVVGKVAYLLRTKQCEPHEILLLSFSRGAVEELAERVRRYCGNQVQVRTFHSLGLEVIAKVTEHKPAVSDQGGKGGLKSIVITHLGEILSGGGRSKKLIDLLAYEFYPAKSEADFKNKNEYLEYLAGHDIRTLKDEKVKSNQEAQIANLLFLNGVEYVYEAEFKEAVTGTVERRVYRPDFYLPQYGIYIEHFGLDRNGNTASWIPKAKYTTDMSWKRSLHAQHKTRLIETFSYMAFEGNLSTFLMDELKKLGVKFKPLSAADLSAMKEVRFRLDALAKLLATALSLFKGDRLTVADLERSVSISGDPRREASFVAVFKELLKHYEKGLKLRGEIDFGDMITEAAGYAESGKYRSPYKVVIVDEFQDISRGRAWFMNALLEQVPDSRLLCVGDDWQSIYRFTGSDVGLMTGYKTQWPQAVRIDLDRTFRFNDKIQQLSAAFVTRNPAQLKKSILCDRQREAPAVCITTDTVEKIQNRILKKKPKASILVLGRYKHTAVGADKPPDADVREMTVHKAKGREADYVIINDVSTGRYGFPSQMADDPLLQLFLPAGDTFTNGEERRLFYVALTRARHVVWVRTNPEQVSPFVSELLNSREYDGLVFQEGGALASQKCPQCGGATRVKRNGTTGEMFLSCVLYPRCKGTIPGCPSCKHAIPVPEEGRFSCPSPSCGWKADKCRLCGSGYIVLRKGRFGTFGACSMYRVTGCRGTSKRRS